jgi:hypothetical protein
MKKILSIFLSVILVACMGATSVTPSLFVPVSAIGNSYYVSPTGNDSNLGTLASPWLTIKKATNTLVAGDIVYIRSGTYNEQVIPVNSGTTSSYITYSAYPNEVVTIDGSTLTLGSGDGLLWLKSKNYINIVGLRIIHAKGGYGTAGIKLNGSSYINMNNNYIFDTASSGIGIWGSNNIVANGNEIVGANASGSEENISIDTSYNIEIKYNLVHNGGASSSGGEGINIKNGSHDVKVHNNIVHDQPKLAFGVDAWTQHTYNLEIYNNIAYNAPHGFIISSEQGGALDNVKVYNNIAYNITQGGFSFPNWSGTKNGPMSNIIFINNISYNNGRGFWSNTTNITNVVVSNNIFSQNKTQMSLASTANITIDHNLFYGNASSVLGTNYVIGDPKFVNPPANFHLQASSPAIDTGTSLNAPTTDADGNTRPRGAGIDIGAYEYINGTPVSTFTVVPTLTSTVKPTSTSTLIPTSTSTLIPTIIPTKTSTPVFTPTITPTLVITPTEECIIVVFHDGTRIKVCH